MSKISNVLRFLTLNYPHSDELSKTRLTKMIYLADWYSAQQNGRQITDIEWYFDHYGPFVTDVYEETIKDKYLFIEKSQTVYGSPKEIIKFDMKYKDEKIKLTQDEINILNYIIENTKTLTWNDFINTVYSTYPIRKQKKYAHLDLTQLAKEKIKQTTGQNY